MDFKDSISIYSSEILLLTFWNFFKSTVYSIPFDYLFLRLKIVASMSALDFRSIFSWASISIIVFSLSSSILFFLESEEEVDCSIWVYFDFHSSSMLLTWFSSFNISASLVERLSFSFWMISLELFLGWWTISGMLILVKRVSMSSFSFSSNLFESSSFLDLYRPIVSLTWLSSSSFRLRSTIFVS